MWWPQVSRWVREEGCMHGRVSMSGRCSRGVLVPGGDGTIVMAGYSLRAFLLIM